MAKTKEKKGRKVAPKPSQKSLPGLEDRASEALEGLAEALAKVRSKRMTLTRQEHEYAVDLLAAMKKRKRLEYHHGEIHIWVRTTQEKVSVKIGELTEEQQEEVEVGQAPDQAPDTETENESVPEFEEEVPDVEEEESEDENIAV